MLHEPLSQNPSTRAFDYTGLSVEERIVVQQCTTEIRDRVRRSLQDLIEVGERLLQVKARLPHGMFGVWLQQEFAWSDSTAVKLMHVAERCKSVPSTDLIGNIGFKAITLLCAPSVPEDVFAQAVTQLKEGQPITPNDAQQMIATHRQSASALFVATRAEASAQILSDDHLHTMLSPDYIASGWKVEAVEDGYRAYLIHEKPASITPICIDGSQLCTTVRAHTEALQWLKENNWMIMPLLRNGTQPILKAVHRQRRAWNTRACSTIVEIAADARAIAEAEENDTRNTVAEAADATQETPQPSNVVPDIEAFIAQAEACDAGPMRNQALQHGYGMLWAVRNPELRISLRQRLDRLRDVPEGALPMHPMPLDHMVQEQHGEPIGSAPSGQMVVSLRNEPVAGATQVANPVVQLPADLHEAGFWYTHDRDGRIVLGDTTSWRASGRGLDVLIQLARARLAATSSPTLLVQSQRTLQAFFASMPIDTNSAWRLIALALCTPSEGSCIAELDLDQLETFVIEHIMNRVFAYSRDVLQQTFDVSSD